MIELRKAIVTELKKYHDDVYYQKAPSGVSPLYVVYDFPNSFFEGEREIFNLDVDLWDNNDDTTALETITGNIWRGLNKLTYIDENIQFSIYRENRLPPLDESDKNYKRRKLIFQVRYYDRRI